jgi:hypothetical protein
MAGVLQDLCNGIFARMTKTEGALANYGAKFRYGPNSNQSISHNMLIFIDKFRKAKGSAQHG